MPGQVNVGSAYISLRARTNEFVRGVRRSSDAIRTQERTLRSLRRGVRQTNQRFREFRRSVLSVRGAVGLIAGSAGLGLLIKRQAEFGASLVETSERLGFSIERLQLLQRAFEGEGIAINATNIGLQRFTRRLAEADAGQQQLRHTFRQLGVELRASNGRLRDSHDVLLDVAEGLKNTENQQERVRLAFKLFDSEGVAFVNVLQRGRDALFEQENAFRRLGVVGEEEARALKDLSQSFTDLGNAAQIAAARGVAQAADDLRQFNEQLIEHGPQAVSAMVKAVATLVRNIDALGDTLVFTGVLFAGRFVFQVGQAVSALQGLSAAAIAARIGVGSLAGPAGLAIAASSLAFYAIQAKQAADQTRLLRQARRELTGRSGEEIGLVTSIEQQLSSADTARQRLEAAQAGIRRVSEEIQKINALLVEGVEDFSRRLTLRTNVEDLRKFQGDLLKFIQSVAEQPLEIPARIKLIAEDFDFLGRKPTEEVLVTAAPFTEDSLRNYNAELERGLTLAQQELELARAVGVERLQLQAQFKIVNDLQARKVALAHQLEDAQKRLAAASEQEKDSAISAVEAAEANLNAFESRMLPAADELTAKYLEQLQAQQQVTQELSSQQALLQAPIQVLRFEDEITDSIRDLEEELNRLTGQAVEATARGVIEARRQDIARELRDAALLSDEAAATGLFEQLDLIKANETALFKLGQRRLDVEQLIADTKTQQQVEQAVQPFLIEEFDKTIAAELKRIDNANRLALLRGEELFEERQLIKLEGTRADLDKAIAAAKEKGNRQEQEALEKAREAVNDRLGRTSALTDELREQLRIDRERQKAIKEFTDRQKELQQAAEGFSKAITKGMEDAILGANSLRDALAGVLEEIAKILLRVALLNQLEKALTGVFGGVFGVPGKAVSVPGRAAGGPVEAGRLYQVNEDGVELFRPRTAGEIIPNHVLRSATPIGGGAPVINISINIQSSDGPGVRAALAEAIPVIENRVTRAVKGDVTRDLLRPSVLRRTRER